MQRRLPQKIRVKRKLVTPIPRKQLNRLIGCPVDIWMSAGQAIFEVREFSDF